MNFLESVTDEEFSVFTREFYRRSGIRLTSDKKYLVIHRLQRLVRPEDGIESFLDLSRILKEGKNTRLITQFVDALTTNYSYFFRDPVHFRFLRYYFTYKAPRDRPIRIWSAACSTGEEPYSIALLLREAFPDVFAANVRIIASDISKSVLEKAREGIYRKESLTKNLNDAALRKYFDETDKSGFLAIKPEFARNIEFHSINLLEPYPFRFSFDLVFLRNVLIYFDRDKREQVLSNIAKYVKPQGYLLISMSESLVGVDHPFHHIRHSIYRL